MQILFHQSVDQNKHLSEIEEAKKKKTKTKQVYQCQKAIFVLNFFCSRVKSDGKQINYIQLPFYFSFSFQKFSFWISQEGEINQGKKRLHQVVTEGFTFSIAIRRHLVAAWKRGLVHVHEAWSQPLQDTCPIENSLFSPSNPLFCRQGAASSFG